MGNTLISRQKRENSSLIHPSHKAGGVLIIYFGYETKEKDDFGTDNYEWGTKEQGGKMC